MSELHDLSALEQAAGMRRRAFSPVELLDHYERRADALDATVGAFITRTHDLALAQARAAERRILAAVPGEPLGPLYGTVVPPKDLARVAGVRCTYGSTTYDHIPAEDDRVVTRMRDGGLVFTGKTNTPEFGLPCYTENDVAPPARTPWDLTRSAGGSSGGAAAAVASGLASAAHGSDGGGSIRIPASVTGLVGLKPARGRISNGPLPDSVGSWPTRGCWRAPSATPRRCWTCSRARLRDDLLRAPQARPGEFLAACDDPPGRLRVGRYATPVIAVTDVDPHCLAAYERASALLESLGHDVEDVPPPFGPRWCPPSRRCGPSSRGPSPSPRRTSSGCGR